MTVSAKEEYKLQLSSILSIPAPADELDQSTLSPEESEILRLNAEEELQAQLRKKRQTKIEMDLAQVDREIAPIQAKVQALEHVRREFTY